MKMRLCYFVLFASVVFIASGCIESLPNGVTKVVPATVRVTVGGSPLDKADLQLVGEGELRGVSVSGQTDAQGVAVLKSVKGDWIKQGAPVGKYRVAVRKVMPVEGEKSDAEINAMSQEECMEYYKKINAAREKVKLPFPESCTSSKTTPLTLEIKDDSLELVLNLDEAAQ